MKLFFCPECVDIVCLRVGVPRSCACGKCAGMYLDDGLQAELSGPAVPLGFANSTFVKALQTRPNRGPGTRFTAFVIERKCPTIRQKP